uniref:Uncharacterized protein n=1 Tax=Cacopsylla melanoneura TaxID=428564 RepID=A0A8D9AXW1_9HEMI
MSKIKTPPKKGSEDINIPYRVDIKKKKQISSNKAAKAPLTIPVLYSHIIFPSSLIPLLSLLQSFFFLPFPFLSPQFLPPFSLSSYHLSSLTLALISSLYFFSISFPPVSTIDLVHHLKGSLHTNFISFFLVQSVRRGFLFVFP